MAEFTTHIRSWCFHRNDVHLHGEPVELERALAEKRPHGVVYVFLIKRFKQRGKLKTVFYLQKRPGFKELYPGKLTISASGRIRHGETVLQAARREVKEELGVAIRSAKLLTSKPLVLDPSKPFLFFFPVLAIAKGVPRPNPREVELLGSGYYSARQLASRLDGKRLTPAFRNFVKTIAVAKAAKTRKTQLYHLPALRAKAPKKRGKK